MRIHVNRFVSDNATTLSTIKANNNFICFGLEDQYRTGQKVLGETRIPEGIYKIKLRTIGGFHSRYSKVFDNMHKGMLELVDVPNFKYVLIHMGNTHEDTAGCLLTGTTADSTNGKMRVNNSKRAYIKLYKHVVEHAVAGNLDIRIEDDDL